jgi:hypothetical protein
MGDLEEKYRSDLDVFQVLTPPPPPPSLRGVCAARRPFGPRVRGALPIFSAIRSFAASSGFQRAADGLWPRRGPCAVSGEGRRSIAGMG